jgi:hypothetical protein
MIKVERDRLATLKRTSKKRITYRRPERLERKVSAHAATGVVSKEWGVAARALCYEQKKRRMLS